MERKPLEDWTEPIRTLLRIHPLDRGDSTIYIGMEQSSPHGSRKVCFLRVQYVLYLF